ncbi:MAG TPA: cytochrome c family protein [Spirochaetota bacterium]|nr:cytochrome c family protein [Spirochaetota bacterium]
MLKKLAVAASAVAILALVPTEPIESRRNFPSFIGVSECKKCHDADSIGNQHKIWLGSPHARAYQSLSLDKGLEIARKAGVEAPAQSLACLKCHTTGGGKTEAAKTEGVGCEACHGPGSLYHEFSNHASFEARENSYRKAVSLGMYPILGYDGIKTRERLCRYCHTEERPCYPESAEERKRQKLPLGLIADFVFKHPIRRR